MAIPCLKLPKLSIQLQIKKSVEGLLGIRTLGCRIIGADVSSEIWRDAQELVPNNPPKIVPVSSSFSFETSRQPNCRLVSADASKGTHVPMTVKRGFTIPSINISITNAFISSERVIYCRSRTASRDLVIRDGWSGGSWYSTSQPTLH